MLIWLNNPMDLSPIIYPLKWWDWRRRLLAFLWLAANLLKSYAFYRKSTGQSIPEVGGPARKTRDPQQ